MKTVLHVNHAEEACGIQQQGKRVFEIVQDSPNVNYVYREIGSLSRFVEIVNQIKPDAILYNWHHFTMSWLTPEAVKNTGVMSAFCHHDTVVPKYYDKFICFGDYPLDNNLVDKSKRVLLPRPLLPTYQGEYKKNDIITIGSFGFAFWQKGFHLLVKLVNETFDKAIINLHIPASYFADRDGKIAKEVANECRKMNTNPGIQLNIDQKFRDTESILEFLAGNDINAFMYTAGGGGGLTGTMDYALAVRRPIAISNYEMFRHIMKDDIRLDKHSLQDILAQGTKPLEEFYDRWSNKNFMKEMDKLFI